MHQDAAANKRKTVIMLLIFIVLVAAVGYLLALRFGKPFITPYIIIGSLVYALISYLAGSRMALAVSGAKPIERSDNPRLFKIVENLAMTDGLPMPKVYIIDDPAPNAFATGRDPAHASVAVTTGLLDIMDKPELEGVLAHEMGHVKNYDIRVMMLAFGLVAAIGLMADILLRISWFGGGRDDDNNSGGNVLFFLGLAAAVLSPIVASLIQLAVSRQREYLADVTGAQTTRYPEGLARALQKISESGSAMRRQNPSTAHLFFANPLSRKNIANLFSTHPPIADRIARLQSMEKL